MLARTSWTRTPQTPWIAAIVVSATLASSRSSTGRGVPSGPARRVPRNDLRLDPTRMGAPSVLQLRQPLQQLPVVVGGLGEPEPGVDDEPVGRDPAAARARRAAGRARCGRRPARRRTSRAAHHRGVAAPVHHDVRRTVLGHDVEDPRVGQPAGDVVDQDRPGLESRPGDLVPHRVHRDRRRRRPASARMTGTTRSSSSATSGRVAPGRVDSPPMSSRSAPCARSSAPCAIAASVVP